MKNIEINWHQIRLWAMIFVWGMIIGEIVYHYVKRKNSQFFSRSFYWFFGAFAALIGNELLDMYNVFPLPAINPLMFYVKIFFQAGLISLLLLIALQEIRWSMINNRNE